jgi:hypothetical protein
MIKVRYSSIDHFRKVRSFKTLEGARKFATNYVGENPSIGEWGGYAVSDDGVGKIEVDGCSLQELFYGKAKATGPYEVWIIHVYEEGPTISSKYRESAHATLAEANAAAQEADEAGVDGVEIHGTTDEAKAALAAQRAAYEADRMAELDMYPPIILAAPYKAYRLAGCVCSEMQLSHVGCECEASR